MTDKEKQRFQFEVNYRWGKPIENLAAKLEMTK
jgi:hypothetical protein